jgi:hypothetical protein
MKQAFSNLDERWSAPSTRLEQLAPLIAFALAGLLAWS